MLQALLYDCEVRVNKNIIIALTGILALLLTIYSFNVDEQEKTIQETDRNQSDQFKSLSSQKTKRKGTTFNDLIDKKISQPKSDYISLFREDNEYKAFQYSDELDILLSEKNVDKRRKFIKEKTKTLTIDSFYDVISEYRKNPDERSARRIISRAILSEIHNDSLLDIFYEEVVCDQTLLPDFVSATYYTNSQNSFDKLMEIQDLDYEEKVMADLKRGTLMMYQDNINSELISHIELWISNRSYISNNQEIILLELLIQAPISKAEPVVNNNILKFSLAGQKALKDHFDSIPRRELR